MLDKEASGSQTFTASGTFTVPLGYSEVEVVMVGGGGSGGNSAMGYPAGGFKGVYVSQTATGLSSGQSITIIVGGGGIGSTGAGYAGKATSFGVITALGGAGGTVEGTNTAVYRGSGESHISSFDGTIYYDGTSWYSIYGGQASEFGNGGDAPSGIGIDGIAGSVGAGGSGSAYSVSGAGGRGEVRITWTR